MQVGMGIYSGVDFFEMVEIFKKVGIKRTFIDSENPEFYDLMKLYKENGIICETLHAPFNKINDMWSDDEKAAQNMMDRLKDAIDKCANNGIPVVIVHLSSGIPMPEMNEKGIKRFEEIFKFADDRNVTIALENLRYIENLEFFLNEYKNTGFCWDTGHEFALSVDNNIRFMERFGKRAVALHIHDNRCEFNKDDHLIPYDGKIDFELVAKTIVESGYSGTLMLEISKNAEIDGVKPYENINSEEFIKRAYDALCRLNDSVARYNEKGE